MTPTELARKHQVKWKHDGINKTVLWYKFTRATSKLPIDTGCSNTCYIRRHELISTKVKTTLSGHFNYNTLEHEY